MSPIPTLHPLGETLGTEVRGINLATALDAPTIAWIHQTFAEHPVLVFRDQDLGANELAAFGRSFGVPRKHSLVKYRHADNDDVSWITNVNADGKITTFEMRVKYLPNPTGYVGSKQGGPMSSAEFKAIGGLLARLDNSDFISPFPVVGYKIAALGGGISSYVEATVDGRSVLVGNEKLMRRHNIVMDEFATVDNYPNRAETVGAPC